MFYLWLKSLGHAVHNHPVVGRIVEIRKVTLMSLLLINRYSQIVYLLTVVVPSPKVGSLVWLNFDFLDDL